MTFITRLPEQKPGRVILTQLVWQVSDQSVPSRPAGGTPIACCESVQTDYSLRWRLSRTCVVICSLVRPVIWTNPALGHTRLPLAGFSTAEKLQNLRIMQENSYTEPIGVLSCKS